MSTVEIILLPSTWVTLEGGGLITSGGCWPHSHAKTQGGISHSKLFLRFCRSWRTFIAETQKGTPRAAKNCICGFPCLVPPSFSCPPRIQCQNWAQLSPPVALVSKAVISAAGICSAARTALCFGAGPSIHHRHALTENSSGKHHQMGFQTLE